MENELWLTGLFNTYLAGVANMILGWFGLVAEHADKPWENWIVVELVVVALLVIAVAVTRAGLSVEKPGTLQHIFESIHGFIRETVDQVGIHHGQKYVPYIATIFIFILSLNLIGIIPAFEAPTMSPWVAAGLAVVTFLYFNLVGFQANGIGYLAQFAGPVRFPSKIATIAIVLFMIPIETTSIFIRPLSLTVRLFGNMFAGEQVTTVFLGLTRFIIPVIFMGLHVFVSLIQAYVFTLLTTIYISQAVSHEH